MTDRISAAGAPQSPPPRAPAPATAEPDLGALLGQDLADRSDLGGDNLAFSFPALMAHGASAEAGEAVRDAYRLARQPLPAAERLARLDALVRQSSAAFGLKAAGGAIGELRGAAGEAAAAVVEDELVELREGRGLGRDQRESRLQALRQGVDQLGWLAAADLAALRLKLTFAAGTLGGR